MGQPLPPTMAMPVKPMPKSDGLLSEHPIRLVNPEHAYIHSEHSGIPITMRIRTSRLIRIF